ncbi:DUF4190 domain-containing protein [Mahella australiensis]|uniref:DUF4190 domain-containing protein n=1 Tax=Mahella australiensis (strain DSM 15567 / CIP 107919 / 50-1 BON) TaxID=697281 RepID=F3ZZX1_MAHA5|nr:DUF4190 domain-containing protein [Mahella australiensis]AEE95789.1 hypothetical protein Mahau_0586 [Mahella australiensis 50-1 BON]
MDELQQPVPEDSIKPKKDHAMLSLILGLIGIIAWIIPIIGFPVTIIGLICGVNSLKGNRRGIALAGTILSVIFLLATTVNSVSGAYQGATGQLEQTPVWHMLDLNFETNGNVATAVELLKNMTAEQLRQDAITVDSGLATKELLKYYGKVLKFSGTVAVVQDYSPGSRAAAFFNEGDQCGEIVFHSDDAAKAPISYIHLNNIGDLTAGEYVTVYGFAVGHLNVENELGGETTQLVVIGKAFDKQANPSPAQEQSSGENEQAVSQPDQETESNEENIYIPGLMSGDIKVNLEQTWGLQFTGPKIGEEFAQDNGEALDPDTGAILTCTIFEDSPLNIKWVDFMIDASPVIGLIDADTINSLAEGYFGYCATIPYDGADPEKAKQWVEDNAKKAIKPGTVLSTQIGSASFEMFGTEYMRTLRIKPFTE